MDTTTLETRLMSIRFGRVGGELFNRNGRCRIKNSIKDVAIMGLVTWLSAQALDVKNFVQQKVEIATIKILGCHAGLKMIVYVRRRIMGLS